MAAARFDYHRAVAPLMWVFVALATVELIVVHLLVATLWSRTAALVLSLATAASMAWLIGVIASMRRLPVVIEHDRLVMRVGRLRRVDIPVAQVAGLRRDWDAAWLKRAGVVNLALIAYPNIVVAIDPPLPARRPIRAVAHRLDDPAAFAQAIERLIAAR